MGFDVTDGVYELRIKEMKCVISEKKKTPGIEATFELLFNGKTLEYKDTIWDTENSNYFDIKMSIFVDCFNVSLPNLLGGEKWSERILTWVGKKGRAEFGHAKETWTDSVTGEKRSKDVCKIIRYLSVDEQAQPKTQNTDIENFPEDIPF